MSIPTSHPSEAAELTEEQALALDRQRNEQKKNGTYDRVAADAAMRLDAQHGVGLL